MLLVQDNRIGGAGGSGIVVVRYQIQATQSGTAKATGGSISYFGGKTIHTFTVLALLQILRVQI